MLLSATPPSTFFWPNVRDFLHIMWITFWPLHSLELFEFQFLYQNMEEILETHVYHSRLKFHPSCWKFAQNSPWDQNSLKSPSWTRIHLNSLHFGKTSFGGCHQLFWSCRQHAFLLNVSMTKQADRGMKPKVFAMWHSSEIQLTHQLPLFWQFYQLYSLDIYSL